MYRHIQIWEDSCPLRKIVGSKAPFAQRVSAGDTAPKRRNPAGETEGLFWGKQAQQFLFSRKADLSDGFCLQKHPLTFPQRSATPGKDGSNPHSATCRIKPVCFSATCSSLCPTPFPPPVLRDSPGSLIPINLCFCPQSDLVQQFLCTITYKEHLHTRGIEALDHTRSIPGKSVLVLQPDRMGWKPRPFSNHVCSLWTST